MQNALLAKIDFLHILWKAHHCDDGIPPLGALGDAAAKLRALGNQCVCRLFAPGVDGYTVAGL